MYFEGLVQYLRYIMYIKNLGLKYYAKIEYAPIRELLKWVIIKNYNQMMVFYDYIWQVCPDTGRSTGAYVVFYQVVPIDHYTHVPGTVDQYSAKSEYNAAYTVGMSLAHFRILKMSL